MQASAPGGARRPDPRYDDPLLLDAELRRRVLPLVSKPGRYLGGELGAVRVPWRDDRANLLLAFPDVYELGISNHGLRLLYAAVNGDPDAYADLAFTPWPDMEARLRETGLPLFALESRRPARAFDVIGLSLGYELGYTNVLTLLDLAGIPLRADARGGDDPLVIAGGHCAANPAVMGPFLDAVCLGDGEELILDVARAVREAKAAGEDRAARLARVREIPGVWWPGRPDRAEARVVADLNAHPSPAILVPTLEAVHDRLSLEVMRGCARGCRFCQAGMITRPVRERDVARVVEAAVDGSERLGWDEISLLSLSTCDYSGLGDAMTGILAGVADRRTALELPSLRVDALDEQVYDLIRAEHPPSFTFAPEAGTQRLRDVINKGVTEADVLDSVRRAFAAGAKRIKLYFMIGLPTETDEDLDGIIALTRRIVGLAPRGGSQVTVSISPFSPKAHTPFQWAGQIPREEIGRRNRYLADGLRRSRVKVSLRDPDVSRLEAILGLGDARLADAVEAAWRAGARFDGWDEFFDMDLWDAAFAEAEVAPDEILAPRDPEAPLPWDGVFARVDREFLAADWRDALQGETVPDCRLQGGCSRCEACGPGLDHVFALPAAGPLMPPPEPVAPAFDPRNADPEHPDRERDRWRKWRERAPGKCWHRVVYAKTGDAAFWGHLDFQRQLRLALRRADLPVAYSQGFTPHPLVKFGPPLPLGVEGDAELMDLALTRAVPGWEAALNAQLPAGVRVLHSVEVGPVLPGAIEKDVDRYDYSAELPLPYGGPGPDALRRLCAEFLDADARIHLRRRPKGDVEIDVRPLLEGDRLTVSETPGPDAGGAVLEFSLRRRSGEAGLSAFEFLAALCGDELPEPRLARVRRTALLARRDDGGWMSPLARIRDLNLRLWLREHLTA